NGIWQLNRRDQPYGKSPHGGDYGHTPWDEAMNLPGSKQVGIARKILEQFEWWRFEPRDDWAAYAKGKEALEPQWGKWIWFNEGNPTADAPVAKRYFRKTFDLPENVKSMRGMLWLSVDDRFDATLNGKHVGGRRGGFESPEPIDITA